MYLDHEINFWIGKGAYWGIKETRMENGKVRVIEDIFLLPYTHPYNT